jgi:hypothetical protein
MSTLLKVGTRIPRRVKIMTRSANCRVRDNASKKNHGYSLIAVAKKSQMLGAWGASSYMTCPKPSFKYQ